jgi:hypothetical protein
VSQDDEKVGKGRPPRHSRFKPGQSGNPKGRPKGARNFSSRVLAAMNEKVPVTERGRRRQITKFDAALTQLSNKAASGDLRAMKLGIELMMQAEHASALGEAKRSPEARQAQDDLVLKVLRARIGSSRGGDEDPS